MGIILQLQDDNNLIGQPQFKEAGGNYNQQLTQDSPNNSWAARTQSRHSNLPAEWQPFSATGRYSQIFKWR